MSTMKDLQFWDRIASKYAKGPIRDEAAYQQTLDRTRANFKPTDRVLEIGCGTGTTAIKLAPDAEGILGTDLAPAMIGIARQRALEAGAENVTFSVAPVEDLPEGPFDVVMGFNLLHLLRDLNGSLADISARLRPGGLFISKTVCMTGTGVPLWMRGLLLVLPVMQLIGKAPYFRKISVRALEEAITRAGLEIVETGNYPDKPPRRFIVARKPG
ncbi:class I SAM-dependent methyltransferase [Alisedimentitalea sp. MJ-SS2]|uniref:class I SAM-dependent methyltransferase n=1 Tax=Aliisedimentitalea sp. MJ-SS2 TaxID=3049795 RepID=UPI0029067926|nr:class I SAM-dependent methyltransferase [Alisedimentitalea sp. MJ-SS2]MDU8928464.1 class I SAM-dependent methyltransferase [Alisedimentitalea sp. MJ-SS2]